MTLDYCPYCFIELDARVAGACAHYPEGRGERSVIVGQSPSDGDGDEGDGK
jgi:hypothetical protein